MGTRTGQENTWSAQRVRTCRAKNGIRAYKSAHKAGAWLTMSEADHHAHSFPRNGGGQVVEDALNIMPP